ncbi:hypothetical protein SAMN02745121_02016 [Nannocystis exedens]|uniref:Uncharacterized protein n=1 Tax=Nannocystis exedens TaxID=54 RepID=A0A1I1VWM9_9BACT|nr:hypothetical protein NAEX_05984 [Nannocystis exedens]SFD87149.1 hypothetical protein SAMN02745121_02016 [Nannocystis exedens]
MQPGEAVLGLAEAAAACQSDALERALQNEASAARRSAYFAATEESAMSVISAGT